MSDPIKHDPLMIYCAGCDRYYDTLLYDECPNCEIEIYVDDEDPYAVGGYLKEDDDD